MTGGPRAVEDFLEGFCAEPPHLANSDQVEVRFRDVSP